MAIQFFNLNVSPWWIIFFTMTLLIFSHLGKNMISWSLFRFKIIFSYYSMIIFFCVVVISLCNLSIILYLLSGIVMVSIFCHLRLGLQYTAHDDRSCCFRLHLAHLLAQSWREHEGFLDYFFVFVLYVLARNDKTL